MTNPVELFNRRNESGHPKELESEKSRKACRIRWWNIQKQ